MNNRRGSFTVFLVIIFSTVLVLLFVVIHTAISDTVSASVNHFGRLWGTSILAEYDRNLQQRYSLYGFQGEPSMIAEKLSHYAEYSFQEKGWTDYDGAVCSLDGNNLTQPDILKRQMEEAVIMMNRPDPMYRTSRSGQAADGEKRDVPGGDSSFGSRTVTSRWILDNLPSKGKKDEADVSDAAAKIREGLSLDSIAGQAAVNQYILTYFRHYRSGNELGDTYFQNEIEYILTGHADDERARKKVKQKLVLLRNLLNLTYLYSSPEKREAAMALAVLLTPGPEAALTQAALLELWAFAEAENDVKLLYADETVPLVKTDATWALTLENAMNAPDGPIHPAVSEGYPYESYLRILLSLIPEETRLLRVMDLIQINMKFLYNGTFRLKDYYTGLSFTLKVNGKEYDFKECYERTKKEDTESSVPEGKLSG